jgi:hypothetical protein
METTESLIVKIQPRFEGDPTPAAFYDISGRIDSDGFEFTSSADGATASAQISLFTLFPLEDKRWTEYATAQEAVEDSKFYFNIPARTEIQIWEAASWHDESPELLFGGLVMQVEEERIGGGIVQRLTCSDYTALLDERVVEQYRVPRDTYGWEMIKGGVAYEDGLVGIAQISSTPDPTPYRNFTHVSYDATQDINKATSASHDFIKGERFKHQPTGIEYEIVGISGDAVFYRRSSASGALSLTSGFRVWSHKILVTTVEDHLYARNQTFNFPNIAHFNSSFYAIHEITSNLKFVSMHRVSTATATASSPFTDVTVVNITSIGSVDPNSNKNSADFAFAECSIEHPFSVGQTVRFTADQKALLSPWLNLLSESPASSGLYAATVRSVTSPYSFAIDNDLTTGDAPVEIAGYADGYPIRVQAYTLSIFEAVRNSNPFQDSYDSIGVNYKGYVDEVETTRYNPILYGYKDSYPNEPVNEADPLGSRAKIWIDFSRKGSELDGVAFDPTTNSATSPVRHLSKILNRATGDRSLFATIPNVTVIYDNSTKVLTLDIFAGGSLNIVVGDRISISNISGAPTGTDADTIANQELVITSIPSLVTVDLEDDANSAIPNDFTIPASATCTVRLLPNYDDDTGDIKIFTERPHSLIAGETIDLVNFKANTKISEVDDANFTITEVSTANDPSGGKYSSISIDVGGIDPDIELYPDNNLHKSEKATMISSGAELSAPARKHRVIHAMRETTTKLTVVTAEIVNSYEVINTNEFYVWLDDNAEAFFANNQRVRVLGLSAPFSGRFRVKEILDNRVRLYSQSTLGPGVSRIVTAASYSSPNITYTSSAHGFVEGQKVNVSGDTINWSVTEGEIISAATNTFVVARQNAAPTVPFVPNGLVNLAKVTEAIGITSFSRYKGSRTIGGETKTDKIWSAYFVADNHGLAVGDEIYIDIASGPDQVLCESGFAKITKVLRNQFHFEASGSGEILSLSSPADISATVTRAFPSTTGSSGSIGLMISRADDAYQEQEAFFVSGIGHTNFDASVPMRAGRIKRVEYRSASGSELIHWGDNGVITLYFNKNLGEDLKKSFGEGRSAYFDISSSSVYGTAYANTFSGIYTVFDSGDTGTVGEHIDLGISPATFFIRFIGRPRPALALSANLHVVAQGSIISADYLEYVDGRANVSNTSPYVIGTPGTKKYKPTVRKTPISAFAYLATGDAQIATSVSSKVADGTEVYFSSSDTGLGQRAHSGRKIKVDKRSDTQFRYKVGASSVKATEVRSEAGSTTWQIKLASAPPQAYYPAWNIPFKLIGISNSLALPNTAAKNAVKALNKSAGWAYSSYSYDATKKIITLTGGPSHASTIRVSPGPNAKVSFLNGPSVSAPAGSYVISPNTDKGVVKSDWALNNILNVFQKPSTGVSERNYASDLRIKRRGGAIVEIKYYEWLEAITPGTYSVTAAGAARRYTVTTVEPHNLGSFQPAVEFKGSSGAWQEISGLDNPVVISSPNTFTFTALAGTIETSVACQIRTRKAYTPDSTHLTMPRNPDVYVSGRTAIKFVASQWSSLRGDRFYLDGSVPTGGAGTSKLSSTWAIAMQATELPTAGNYATVFQHGTVANAPYLSFGIDSDGHPWASFIVNSGGTRTKYTATDITLYAGEDCVLQLRVAYSTSTAATVYISKNTGPEQTLSVPTIYRGGWGGSLSASGSNAGTLILGMEQDGSLTYRYPITAHVGEIIAYDTALSAAEGLELRAWMMHKWALVNFIDSGLVPDYRDLRNVPNNELADSSQVKNAQFGGRTLKQVLESITKTTGAKFWVDKNKNLQYKELNTKNLIKNSIMQDERAVSSSRYWNLSNFAVVTQDPADAAKQPGPYGYGYALGYSGTAAGYAHSDFITENPDKTAVAADKYYFVSAYMKTSDTTKAALRVHFYASGVNTVGSSHDISYVDATPLTRNNEWQRIWSIVKTPATTAKLSVGAIKLSSATAVNVYATNFSCVQLTGAYGFADEGLAYELAPARPFLNSGDTASSFIPMATYPFESPETIRSGGAVANRLYLYASTVNSDENGNTITNETLGQSVLEYTYDYVQGIWRSHGKIIEASQAEDKASTQYELTGKAQAFWKDSGDTINSYEFDHPYNGSAAILEVGSVVPYIWSEVNVVEPMIVKSHRTSLIGSELYHHVSLEQEPDYQKNALVLIGRRQLQVDLATAPEARDRPPAVRNFRIESVDADGKLSTIANEFRMSWQYPFDDPLARGVRESGFEVQVRWRKRTVKDMNKKKMGRTASTTHISVGASTGGDPVRIVIYSKLTKFSGLKVGQPVNISGLNYNAASTTDVNLNGSYRVSEIDSTNNLWFAYDVLAPRTTTPDGQVTYVTRSAVNIVAKAVPDKFMVSYTADQGGTFGEWKNINTKIPGTSFAWDPVSSGPISAATASEISSIGGQADLDFQFRIRAVATNSSKVSVYSVYTVYPSGDAFMTIATTKTLEG